MFSNYVKSLVKMRVNLGRVTGWEEECFSWGEPLAIHKVFQHFKGMTEVVDRSLILKKDVSIDPQSPWRLDTYVAHWQS